MVTFSSSTATFKPGSSGRSRTAPSPSLCPSLSWRGPSGKSSSPRLSKTNRHTNAAPFDRSALLSRCQHHLEVLPVLVSLLRASLSLHRLPSFYLWVGSGLRKPLTACRSACGRFCLVQTTVRLFFFLALFLLFDQQTWQYWSLQDPETGELRKRMSDKSERKQLLLSRNLKRKSQLFSGSSFCKAICQIL